VVGAGHKEALTVKFADSGAKKKLQQRQWLESTPIVRTAVVVQGSHASWKVLESPGFFFLKFQDLESPGKSLWSWKVLEIKA